MLPLAFALAVTAATAFAFKSTRAIGILCIALFTFLFPWITLGLLAFALICFFIIHRR